MSAYNNVFILVFFILRMFANTGEEIACPKFIGQKIEDVLANKEYVGKIICLDNCM